MSFSFLAWGFLLMLIQILAALPWGLLAFFSPEDRKIVWNVPFSPQRLGVVLGIFLLVTLVVPWVFRVLIGGSPDSLETLGRTYAAILQVQLTVDFFIAVFALLLWLWPKAGAIALAAFREAVRQWLFWLITGGAAFFMFVSVF